MNEQVEKYFLGNMNTDERIGFLRKLKEDKELQEEFSRYKNTDALFSFSDGVVDQTDSLRGYRTFIRRIKTKTLYKPALRIISYAAAVALLVLSVHFYHVYYYRNQLMIASETSLFVPAGQRVSLTLGDGTVVWLNARSRLTYPSAFVDDERRVSIDGEAYFEVAEDTDKPFIVSTRGIEMKVLGTSFNVYSYPEEEVCRISLLEGSLQVYNTNVPDKRVTLSPQEEVIIQNDRMTRGHISGNDYFLWKDGIYSFEEENLGNILKKLELYYDIHIEVKDPVILGWKYTVKFRQRDGIDEILRLLNRVHPFNIKKDDEKNMITISR
jgi:ferric-dicitrate binding protein FerR (iron transport regulator)